MNVNENPYNELPMPPLHSVSGTIESKYRGIDPWIVNAARELAMDSTHIPLIAKIIERHAPTFNHEK